SGRSFAALRMTQSILGPRPAQAPHPSSTKPPPLQWSARNPVGAGEVGNGWWGRLRRPRLSHSDPCPLQFARCLVDLAKFFGGETPAGGGSVVGSLVLVFRAGDGDNVVVFC